MVPARCSCRPPRALDPAQAGDPGGGVDLTPDQLGEPLSASAGQPAAEIASASSGTASRPSEAWPISSGISRPACPSPSSSPARRLRPVGAIIVAVRSPTPANPEKVSSSAPCCDRVSGALAPDLGRGDPGRVQAVRLRRGGGQRRGVLRGPGHLDTGHVAGALADEAGPVEDLAELRAQIGVGGAEDQRGGAGDGLAGVGGPPRQAIARARTRSPTYSAGSWPRRDQALGQQQHRGPIADPVGDRPHRLRQRAGRDREADQVGPASSIFARGRTRKESGSATPGR